VGRLEKHLGHKAILLQDEDQQALLADDAFCTQRFGQYRDEAEEMMVAAARWVNSGGTYWDKPTFFGRADHRY
jgi:hypothetical protein